jgi:nitrate/nitrite-specific signal transduction histidine kinase
MEISRTSDLSRHVEIDSSDEIGMLGSSFNEMICSLNITQERLRRPKQRLRHHQEHLEDLVKERTMIWQKPGTGHRKQIESSRPFLPHVTRIRTPLNSIIGFTGLLLQVSRDY